MATKKSYNRYFIIFQEEDKGFGIAIDKQPTGYTKIETRNGKCKITVYAQNLIKEKGPYVCCLIDAAKDPVVMAKLGAVNIDDTGRGETWWEYTEEDIAGTGVSVDRFNVAAIISDGAEVSSPLAGYVGKDRIPWKSKVIIKARESYEKEKYEEEMDENAKKFKEYEEKIKKESNEPEKSLNSENKGQTEGEADNKGNKDGKGTNVENKDNKTGKDENKDGKDGNKDSKDGEGIRKDAAVKGNEKDNKDGNTANKDEKGGKGGNVANKDGNAGNKDGKDAKGGENANKDEKGAKGGNAGNKDTKGGENANKDEKGGKGGNVANKDGNAGNKDGKDTKGGENANKDEKAGKDGNAVNKDGKDGNTGNTGNKDGNLLGQPENDAVEVKGVQDKLESDINSNMFRTGSNGDIRHSDMFHNVLGGFAPVENVPEELGDTKWWRIPHGDVVPVRENRYYPYFCAVYHLKMTYPYINYIKYFKKPGYYNFGIKYDENNEVKYIMYGIEGKNTIADQPYMGMTGFVRWVPYKDSDNGMWVMYYNPHTGNVLIPKKK